MPNKIKAGLSSCKPIFTASTIQNSKPKIPNQKHTNRAHITLIQICIHTWPHTHRNNNTQTHGQMHTHDTTEREIARGKERERERERERKGGFDLWWLTERFEVAVVAIGSRRWRWRRWGVVFRVIESEGLFESLVLRLESDRSEFGGESELRVFSI